MDLVQDTWDGVKRRAEANDDTADELLLAEERSSTSLVFTPAFFQDEKPEEPNQEPPVCRVADPFSLASS